MGLGKKTIGESFELLLKFGKSSFLRIPDRSPGQAQESSLFKTFWIPACAGMTNRNVLGLMGKKINQAA
jgi:hypothetical protein